MNTLAAGLSWIDLLFLGRAHAIATGVVQGAAGVALVDPGPTSCLPALELGLMRHGLALRDVTHILLTHIHLDHAGATGTIVGKHPHISVLVHERGATHLVDPTKLIESASRLYGDDMDRLWGAFAPVPAANLVVLRGGERLEVAGRGFEVAYTPGHASHHVSYFDPSSRLAFVGDTAGVCVDGGYVLPPTPPPDIDLELWKDSVDRIEAWSPDTLFLTHFGPKTDVRAHLRALVENLVTVASYVQQSLDDPGSDEERRSTFISWIRREMGRRMSDTQAASYESAAPLDLLWLGLARYWRKRKG